MVEGITAPLATVATEQPWKQKMEDEQKDSQENPENTGKLPMF